MFSREYRNISSMKRVKYCLKLIVKLYSKFKKVQYWMCFGQLWTGLCHLVLIYIILLTIAFPSSACFSSNFIKKILKLWTQWFLLKQKKHVCVHQITNQRCYEQILYFFSAHSLYSLVSWKIKLMFFFYV